MRSPGFTRRNLNRNGLWVVLLLIAVFAAVLVAGCTSFLPGSKGTTGQPGPWTGTYDSDWGTMTLVQNGNKVTGTYVHDEGKITGTVFGDTLTGTWSESPSYNPPDDAGDVALTLSGDGKSISGTWRYGSDSSGKWDGEWQATRK